MYFQLFFSHHSWPDENFRRVQNNQVSNYETVCNFAPKSLRQYYKKVVYKKVRLKLKGTVSFTHSLLSYSIFLSYSLIALLLGLTTAHIIPSFYLSYLIQHHRDPLLQPHSFLLCPGNCLLDLEVEYAKIKLSESMALAKVCNC